MTKRPNKTYYRPLVYLPRDAEGQVTEAAAAQDKTVSTWIKGLIENALGVDFKMDTQAPHGKGKPRKKSK